MRAFPPEFLTIMSSKDGAFPVWLLKFTAGGINYVLCQDALPIAPWSVTARPWIESWGKLNEGVSGTLADYNISSINVNLINDPSASPNLRSIAKSRLLHGLSMSIYLWFDGCTSAPFEMFRMMVDDVDMPSESAVNLTLQDESLRYEKLTPGIVVTRERYPDADPDDVGKIIPIVFGSVTRLETIAVDAGLKTTISAGMTALQTTMVVSDPTGFWIGMWAGIDDETMLVTGINGSTITVTRGYDSTLATTHQRGADLIEIRPNDFAYQAADHPMQINKVWARLGSKLLDITSISTIYTGNPGNEYPDIPGAAVVTVPGFITLSQAADLMLYDGISVQDQMQVMDGLGVSDMLAISDTIGLIDAIQVADNVGVSDGIAVNDYAITDSGHGHSATTQVNSIITGLPHVLEQSSTVNVWISVPALPAGATNVVYEISVSGIGLTGISIYVPGVLTPWTMDLAISSTSRRNLNATAFIAGTASGGLIQFSVWAWGGLSGGYLEISSIKYSYSMPAGTSSNLASVSKTLANKTGTVAKTGGAYRSGSAYRTGATTRTGAVTRTGTVTRDGSVFKTGTVTLAGNSVANTLIGDAILVDGISPTTAPAACISKVLGVACQQIGPLPATYAFNGAITTSKPAPQWCHQMAWECRSYFKWILGQPVLLARPDVPQSVKNIAAVRLKSGEKIHSQKLTDINDCINTINLCFSRDWSGMTSGDDVYKQAISGKDDASIVVYGTREEAALFKMDFVTDSAMAADLLAFYLAVYAWQRWKHTLTGYLNEAALEFGDWATLGFSEGELVEVIESGLNPGAGMNISDIQITAIG